ncbi:MAG: flagellar basal body-associated FliL family protein [Paracoccaceae bacterium]
MADEEETPQDGGEAAPKKKSKLPMILGLVLALAGGGGGFYATYSGMLLGGDSHGGDDGHGSSAADGHGDSGGGHGAGLPDIAFVPVEPMVVSLGMGSEMKHLRFRAQLEVEPHYQAEVEKLLPRVVDVLNSYLRALDLGDIADASALVRLRAQMLRRIQIVTGENRVNDLLIMEFVLD